MKNLLRVAVAGALFAVACSPPVSDPCLGVTCEPVANGANACVAGACVVTCTAPFVKDAAGAACVSPNTPEACGASATACPTDPNGTATCTAGTCGLTCNTPRIPNAAGDACVSPNTPAACGDALVACADDAHGEPTCSAAGECGLDCDAPYVLDPSRGEGCLTPNTPTACGPGLVACPIDPNGDATCSPEGTCGLTCDDPYILGEGGTSCVSPNTVDACGPAVVVCPTVADGTFECVDEACVLTCRPPLVPAADGLACVSPNTPEACGDALLTCRAPTGGRATCVGGQCGFECPPESDHAPAADACVARYSSCFQLKSAGFVADGTYLLLQPDPLSGTVSLPRYCDQTTDGGGWMRVGAAQAQVGQLAALADVREDADGARITIQANGVGCGGPAADTTFLAPGVPWSQVRYTEAFGNKADCWSVFGDETHGPATPRPNLVPFDPAVDAISNAVGMGFGGADAFTPPLNTCAETPHFWAASRTPRHATLIQRRDRAGEPAGLSTRATCFPDEAAANWTYSAISVRECPFTADACGATCSACPAVANGTPACLRGACGVASCQLGFLPDANRTACVTDCAAHLGALACTPGGATPCADARYNFEDTGTATPNVLATGTGAVGNLVTRVAGVTGQAVRLVPNAGRAGGVDFGNAGNFGTSDFTVMFWAKTATTVFSDVLGNRSAGSHGNFLQLRFQSNGSYVVEIDQDGAGTNYAAATSQAGLNDGNWHHVAVVRSGVNLTLFIDGAQAATAASAGVTNVNNANAFLLGASPRPGVDIVFDATVDELRIYRGALPASEIALVDSACDPT